MPRRALLFIAALLTSAPVFAQLTWQPTPAPPLTAQNESWYLAGDPIEWAGAVYSAVGTPRYFDPYQMTRAGSYHGIPLYTDTMGPVDAIYLPIGRDLMQPYRPAEHPAVTERLSPIPSAARAPRTGEPGPAVEEAGPATAPTGLEGASGTFLVSGTTGRTLEPPRAIESVSPPTGVDGIWVNYDGARWFLAGATVELDRSGFKKIGEYDGFPVYQRDNDRSTIYIPVRGDRLARYSRRVK